MEIERISTKICIVGAGPAGVTTSLTLSQLDIAHTIVDAAEFPRDKICGDALDLNVVRVLKAIAPGFITNEMADTSVFSPAPGLRFTLPNGKYFDMKDQSANKQSTPIFYISKRVAFDRLFAAKLNPETATILLGTRIDKIDKKGPKWVLSGKTKTGNIEIETEMLIGADGAHSIVLKHIGNTKIDRNNFAGSVRNYWKGIGDIHPDRLIEFYFPKKLPFSYFWIFPLPNGEANVGYAMASSYISRKKINVRKAFDDLIKTDEFLAPRFKNAVALEPAKGWGLPLSGSNRKAFGNGWLLVGDAASIICPTTGEGIGSGMMSAYIAAHFIQRAVIENCFEEKMFTHYNREIHKRLIGDEQVFNLLNRFPGWVFNIFINTFFSNRILQKWIVKKEVKKWIETAYTKPIVVNLN